MLFQMQCIYEIKKKQNLFDSQNYNRIFISFIFFVFKMINSKTNLVSTSNNNIKFMNPHNMAPVPTVCVRVPHSPSLGSLPTSPLKNQQNDSHFTALAVRECNHS